MASAMDGEIGHRMLESSFAVDVSMLCVARSRHLCTCTTYACREYKYASSLYSSVRCERINMAAASTPFSLSEISFTLSPEKATLCSTF